MAITSCWNGSCYELFSSKEKAISAAEKVIRGYQKQGHPMGDCFVSQLIEEDSKAYTYQVGPEESLGCIAGDNSPEVAAAVAEWWRARDAAHA